MAGGAAQACGGARRARLQDGLATWHAGQRKGDARVVRVVWSTRQLGGAEVVANSTAVDETGRGAAATVSAARQLCRGSKRAVLESGAAGTGAALAMGQGVHDGARWRAIGGAVQTQ